MDGRGFFNPYTTGFQYGAYMPQAASSFQPSAPYHNNVPGNYPLVNSSYNSQPQSPINNSAQSNIQTASPIDQSSDLNEDTPQRARSTKKLKVEARKAWTAIAEGVNEKFNIQRTTDKYQKKIKYLIERYKIAKDWNRKQNGGHRRESILFKEINAILGSHDVVTTSHVAEAGTSSSASSTSQTSGNDDEETKPATEERTERKKSKKRKKTEEKDDEERKIQREYLDSLNEQRKNMNTFMENFNKMQQEQRQTMNALVGALTGFLQNSSKN